ncbi:hypothetical protein [Paucibacter sp. DJ2R-2]|uniref:hypothetical protein n=1 Tax=Paucibacter sp. DJ2R-2 TaxID=2893558 RepID=UPI0021E4E492|nr:hypothetical protein [Paucibacter sp. DJ2R-2]MCV2438646.1 hypothetical protein [Paucibacter sp. DJ2R-2]
MVLNQDHSPSQEALLKGYCGCDRSSRSILALFAPTLMGRHEESKSATRTSEKTKGQGSFAIVLQIQKSKEKLCRSNIGA